MRVPGLGKRANARSKGGKYPTGARRAFAPSERAEREFDPPERVVWEPIRRGELLQIRYRLICDRPLPLPFHIFLHVRYLFVDCVWGRSLAFLPR